jgi:hypothetical protein
MTDFDRNIRTLIVCFVLVLVGLVPLKIGEAGRALDGGNKVLGEMKERVLKEDNMIILPDVGGIK